MPAVRHSTPYDTHATRLKFNPCRSAIYGEGHAPLFVVSSPQATPDCVFACVGSSNLVSTAAASGYSSIWKEPALMSAVKCQLPT
jgi:hypothetical protein